MVARLAVDGSTGKKSPCFRSARLSASSTIPGCTSARRFAPADGDGPFIAIYELDCDDLDAVVDRLRALGASGKMSSLQYLDMSTPPIPRVLREIGSYGK